MDDTRTAAREPVDADTGLTEGHAARPALEPVTLAVISAGGVLGALARFQAGVWWPTGPGRFPWTTFGINVVGCALIGVLLVLASDVFTTRRLLRPFLGTGVLGGFTTFSAYVVDSQRLTGNGHADIALAYLAGTVAAAMAAVTAATRLTRLAVGVRS